MQAADSADQVLEGFSHYVTNEGILRSKVEADTAFFYEATQITELHKVKVVFFDVKGAESSTLTAQRGTYRWQDGSMEAKGNVVVVSPDGPPLGHQHSALRERNQSDHDGPALHLRSGRASTWKETASARTLTSRMSLPIARAALPERHAAAGAMRRGSGAAGKGGSLSVATGWRVFLSQPPRLPASRLDWPSSRCCRCGNPLTAKPAAVSSRLPTWTGRAPWSRRRRAPTTLPGATLQLSCKGSQVTMQSDSVAAYGGTSCILSAT